MNPFFHNPQNMNLQIVSRYVPIENQAGHFSYLLELLHYLHGAGFCMELDVLDPWFLQEDIPDDLHEIVDVVLMPMSYIQTDWNSASTLDPSLKPFLRPIYQRLPTSLLKPLRQAWYRFRRTPLPGYHIADAAATEAEMTFVADRLAVARPAVLMSNETFLGNLLTLCQHETEVLKVNIAFDVQHKRQETFRKTGIIHSSSIWNRQKEVDLLSAADVIVAIHHEEADIFQDMLPEAEIVCAPMAVRFHQHHEKQQVRGRCLFVGSDIEHNVYGLKWFLNEVWPLVDRVLPTSELHVCGTVCAKITDSTQNVKLLGKVEDLDQEYAEAKLCIIPLIAGSGLKIKLVEALSHGRACVSTSIGIQGVRELEGKAVLVAEAPETFANAILTVLKDEKKRQAMELEAKQYVTENLSPENVYRPFMKRIEQHLIHFQKRKESL
ncbi:hypothetical protein CSA56_16970 [candidate division KSB3 bacterium]|uniref:Glycosyltransferase n=1 Tax=candidate division KSB3 bacterium TaxID=2044937 RepID=A0A2G6K862_9BACT|nr:MAG: hypothetical protein CSA56_16970 [candidate division KSB3 bacterium]